MRRTGALDWLQVCRRTPAPSDLLMALWGPLGPSSRPFLSLDLYALGFSHSYLASLAFYYSPSDGRHGISRPRENTEG